MDKICPVMSKEWIFQGETDERMKNIICCQREKCQLWIDTTVGEHQVDNMVMNKIGHCGLVREG